MTVRLVHVGTQESNARRFLDPVDSTDGGAHQLDDGAFELRPWADGQAMVLLSVRMQDAYHAVEVTIAGLYEFVDGDVVPTEQESVHAFYRSRMPELLPFLRQAVHTASSQVWPVKPLMIDILAGAPEEAGARRRESTSA